MATTKRKFFKLGEKVFIYGRAGVVTEIADELVAVKHENGVTTWCNPTTVKRMAELDDRDYMRALAAKLETALVYNQPDGWTADILRAREIAEKL